MRSAVVIIALLSLVIVRAGEFDKSKLVPLLEFPEEHFEIGFAITYDGIQLIGNDAEPEPSTEEKLARAELRRAIDPRDPDNFRELGHLYLSSGNTNASAAMFAEAESRYRSILAGTNPPRTALAPGFAEVLRANGKSGEAEKLLREQVERSPEDHRSWAALGDHHTIAAYLQLTGEKRSVINAPEMQQAVTKLSAEELAEVNRRFSDAVACYGRAIQVSSNDTAVLRKQMTTQVQADIVRELGRKEGAQDFNERAVQIMFGRYLPGLRQIAKMEPDNPEAVAAWMFAELMASSIKGDLPALMSDDPEAKLSAETKTVLRKGIAQLKRLSKKGDTDRRRVALVSLGFFQSILGEKSAGQRSVKRAIALDRSKPLGWETLSGLYVFEEPPRWKDLLALSRERSKHNDSPRNRFIAAKAAEKLNRPVEAMTELQAGLKLDPRHANSQLAMCALLLREGSADSIVKAHAIIGELVERKDLAYDQWRELMIIGGVCFALADQHDTAQQWFSSLLKREPDDERAKAALAAWKN